MPAEVEAKFRSDGPSPLASLAAEPTLADATLQPGRTIEELDRYLDTTDGRLAAAGWACRLRSRAGVHRVSLKGRERGDGDQWLHRRPEVEGHASDSIDPATWPDSDARHLLLRMADGAPLVELFRLRQKRTERPVFIDGRAFGTLTLDEVTVVHESVDLGRLFAVELEIASDTPRAARHLESLAAALAQRPGLEPDPSSKLEHALALIER